VRQKTGVCVEMYAKVHLFQSTSIRILPTAYRDKPGRDDCLLYIQMRMSQKVLLETLVVILFC